MKLAIHYPWEQTEKGQGFFIPCLDIEEVREEGLKKALSLRMLDARGVTGIRKGFTGVWFYRLAVRNSPQSGSAPP
jgi:hypothetical protein